MIVAKITPQVVVIRRAGVRPVAAVNPVDPTHGLVPFRTNGLVAEMMTRYGKQAESSFHRYAGVSLVGSFEDDEAATKAMPVAEKSLRMRPGPGIYFAEPIDSKGRDGFIWVHGVLATGWVHSSWDPISRSVVNETLNAHFFRKGFVARQASVVGANVFVTTFGEGVNEADLLAWLNGTLGFGGFTGLDTYVSMQMMFQPGFLKTSRAVPDGVNDAYPSSFPVPTEFLQ